MAFASPTTGAVDCTAPSSAAATGGCAREDAVAGGAAANIRSSAPRSAARLSKPSAVRDTSVTAMRSLGRPSVRRISSCMPVLVTPAALVSRSALRLERAAAHLLPSSSSKRRLATRFVGVRPFCSASCARRVATSCASSATHVSSIARVSMGPRALPRRPLKFFDEPTCFASGRSATGASSSPHASRHASSAFSSGCAHSPRSTRATAGAPALRMAPAVSKPGVPASGLPSRNSSPSLPPKPRSRSTGSGSSSDETARGASSVCWSGLCSPPHSLASSLLGATPAEHVKLSWRVTSRRARETTTAPAARSASSSSHSVGVRAHHRADASSICRTTWPLWPARNELRASTPPGCAPRSASSAASASPATWVPPAAAASMISAAHAALANALRAGTVMSM